MSIFQGRSRFLFLFLGLFVSISFLSRSLLLIGHYDSFDIGFFDLLGAYGVGLFYDFITSLYCSIPFVIYLILVPDSVFNSRWHKILSFVWLFVVIYLLLFNVASEWFFWDEFGKRFNFIAVDYLVYTHEVINNILESYPIPLLLGVIFLLSGLIFYFVIRLSSGLKMIFSERSTFVGRAKYGLYVLMLPVIFFSLLQKQELAHISENQYNNELAKNGLYSLFSAFRNNTLDYDEFYKSVNISKVMQNIKTLEGFDNAHIRHIEAKDNEKRYNIMMVVVESLSAKYMGVYGNDKNLTSNLDKLSNKSLFFDNLYATGTRTVRGMEAIVLSLPPTPGRSIVKRPDNHNMFSAGFLFRERGYESKFIYAGHGYFDNMNDFFSHNGFDVVDRNDFDDSEITFANVWGVCDEDLFAKSTKEADKSYSNQKPFFNFIMTTSNHRPFTYPDGKVNIPSHSGRDGGVKYTDYAIGKFIEEAKKKPWFDNTIFVIIADHNGGSAGKSALPLWRYKIPLLIYAPKIIKPRVISKVASQIDTIPTILSMMNWEYDSQFYGNDILGKNFVERAFVGNYQRLGFVRDKSLFILEPNKAIHQEKILENRLNSTTYKSVEQIADRDILDSITYYQSASYLYKNHLNRYRSK